MKKIIITVLIMLLISYAFVTNIYSLSTIVDSIDYNTDIVCVIDFNGNAWEFTGVEDWAVGDICAMTMFTAFTPNIYDDVILNAHYNGYIN